MQLPPGKSSIAQNFADIQGESGQKQCVFWYRFALSSDLFLFFTKCLDFRIVDYAFLTLSV